MYQALQRLGEQYEIIVGWGLLSWADGRTEDLLRHRSTDEDFRGHNQETMPELTRARQFETAMKLPRCFTFERRFLDSTVIRCKYAT